jgi:hypothetical protein
MNFRANTPTLAAPLSRCQPFIGAENATSPNRITIIIIVVERHLLVRALMVRSADFLCPDGSGS